DRGISMLGPEELARVVTALDGEGFDVHVHAIGDRAVRDTLDAFQAAAAANGRRDARHQIAHLQFVHPDDRPRFRRLGVVANAQPLEAETGTVTPGKLADLAILDRDPFDAATGPIADARVLATLVEGDPVHADPSLDLTG